MKRAMIVPVLFGLAGAALLISLGVWQVQRLTWKQGILSEIEEMANGTPGTLAAALEPVFVKYAPVRMAGRTGQAEVHVLVSRKNIGAGYRVITGFDMNSGRRVLLDRGFVRSAAKNEVRVPVDLAVVGNLHLPDDRNSATPANDEAANIWFARDISAMARVLDTEAILIVARSSTGQGVEAMPVRAQGIPNDHLQYAITWFSLAFVWLGMTGLLLWRIKRRTA